MAVQSNRQRKLGLSRLTPIQVQVHGAQSVVRGQRNLDKLRPPWSGVPRRHCNSSVSGIASLCHTRDEPPREPCDPVCRRKKKDFPSCFAICLGWSVTPCPGAGG